jgi:hypothetical protein
MINQEELYGCEFRTAALLLYVITAHISSFFSTVTSSLVPRPLHCVPAPCFCEADRGKSDNAFAMKEGSVRGVRSSRLGSCWRGD